MGASAKMVDLSGVKDRGNFNPKRVEAGDWAAKIVKVEDAESKSNQDFMYVFTFKLEKFSQYSYPYYCKLTENQLWKLRNLLIAAGINVPKKKMKLDPNKVVGRRVGVTMEDDEHEGKMKSVISAVFPASELIDGEEPSSSDEDFDEEAAPAVDDSDDAVEEKPKKKKKDKAAKEEPAKGEKKKGKKKKGSEENLEELDITDL